MRTLRDFFGQLFKSNQLALGSAPFMGFGTLALPDGITALAGGLPAMFPRLQVLTPSSVASANFTLANNSLYRGYFVKIRNLLPATDGAMPYLRASTDQGSSLRSGVEYTYCFMNGTSAGAIGSEVSNGANQLKLSNGVDSATRGISGFVFIYMGAAAYDFQVVSLIELLDGAATSQVISVGGGDNNQANVNGFGFLYSSGNIASGNIVIWGVPL